MAFMAANIAKKWGNLAEEYKKMKPADQELLRGALWEKLVPVIGITDEQAFSYRQTLKDKLKATKPIKSEEQIRAKMEKYAALLHGNKADEQSDDDTSNDQLTASTFFQDTNSSELIRDFKPFIRSVIEEKHFMEIDSSAENWMTRLIQLTREVGDTLKSVGGLTDVLSKEQFRSEKHTEDAKGLIRAYQKEFNDAVALVQESIAFKDKIAQIKSLLVSLQTDVHKEISEKETALKNVSTALAVEAENLQKVMRGAWRYELGSLGERKPVTQVTAKVIIQTEVTNFSSVIEGINKSLNKFMDLSVDDGRRLLGELTGNRHLVSASQLFLTEADVINANKEAFEWYDEISKEYQSIFNNFEMQLNSITQFKYKADLLLDQKMEFSTLQVNKLIESFSLLATRMEGLVKNLSKDDQKFEIKKLAINSKDTYPV